MTKEELQKYCKEASDEIIKQDEKIRKLEDNWKKLKEIISIKLYNVEYLQKLCNCKIDDEIHMILDILIKEMQELEKGSDNNENRQ